MPGFKARGLNGSLDAERKLEEMPASLRWKLAKLAEALVFSQPRYIVFNLKQPII